MSGTPTPLPTSVVPTRLEAGQDGAACSSLPVRSGFAAASIASSEQIVLPAMRAVSPGRQLGDDLAQLLVVVAALHAEDERGEAARVGVDRPGRHLHVELPFAEVC